MKKSVRYNSTRSNSKKRPNAASSVIYTIGPIMKTNQSHKINQSSVHQQGGFTLIELLVVIAIIGILLAIATPAYTSYVQQAHRTDAKNALLDLAAREEKYFSINNTYTADPTQLYGSGTTFPLGVNSNGTTYYN